MSVEKEFVPPQESSELKELGFNEPCLKFYVDGMLALVPDAENGDTNSKLNGYNPLYVSAPTFSQAFRWFREKYGIFNPQRLIFETLGGKYGLQSHDEHDQVDGYFDTYEEAELACLRRLIEIVNKNNYEQQ